MKHPLIEAEESALRSYNRFLDYFKREVEFIEHSSYSGSDKLFHKFKKEVKEQIFGATKKDHYSQIEEFSREIKDRALASRALYLSRVVDCLKEKSKDNKYVPAQGSFWESIGQTLEKLALEVQKRL